MNKYEIVQKFEKFAPLETAESWDASGWLVETGRKNVSKVMFCLTPTDEIVLQAEKLNCDMIISHHPAFLVPCNWKNIDMYCAHTNMDKAKGGTTDTIIKTLGLENNVVNIEHEFLRFVEFKSGIEVCEFSKIISTVFKNARIINNKNVENLYKIAFCAGSGSEFISEAKVLGADCLVTGDLKFHTALDSEIVVYDIGHFESEIIILPVFAALLENVVEYCFAEEKSPFENII